MSFMNGGFTRNGKRKRAFPCYTCVNLDIYTKDIEFYKVRGSFKFGDIITLRGKEGEYGIIGRDYKSDFLLGEMETTRENDSEHVIKILKYYAVELHEIMKELPGYMIFNGKVISEPEVFGQYGTTMINIMVTESFPFTVKLLVPKFLIQDRFKSGWYEAPSLGDEVVVVGYTREYSQGIIIHVQSLNIITYSDTRKKTPEYLFQKGIETGRQQAIRERKKLIRNIRELEIKIRERDTRTTTAQARSKTRVISEKINPEYSFPNNTHLKDHDIILFTHYKDRKSTSIHVQISTAILPVILPGGYKYETMIFGGINDEYQDRYKNKEEAIKNHEMIVEKCLNNNPIEVN